MGTLFTILMYGAIVGVISLVAYYVIKLAVKHALQEYEQERSQRKGFF